MFNDRATMTVSELLEGLSNQEVMDRFSPQERLERLAPEERVQGLAPYSHNGIDVFHFVQQHPNQTS